MLDLDLISEGLSEHSSRTLINPNNPNTPSHIGLPVL